MQITNIKPAASRTIWPQSQFIILPDALEKGMPHLALGRPERRFSLALKAQQRSGSGTHGGKRDHTCVKDFHD
jgi:hypothetical protein